MENLKVAIVGTHGVPAKYGGFETLADFLCQQLQGKVQFTVYCNSKKYPIKNKEYYGARLKYVGLNASGFQGILYDMLTYFHALIFADVILYLSPVGSGCIIPIKLFFRKRVIVNHGGLNEWERPKLSLFQKKLAKLNHFIAGRFADINIADNLAYQQSLHNAFKVSSTVIRYGANHSRRISRSDSRFRLQYSFLPDKYAVSISRAQVDNNLHVVLSAFKVFKNFPLVLISNWAVSEYGKKLRTEYANCDNIYLRDAIYDKDELDYIRGNAFCYIHSHSFCGTAPSLIEAMNLGRAIFSFDVATNREATNDMAFFFVTNQALVKLLENVSEDDIIKNGLAMLEIAQSNYKWEHIASQYYDLFTQHLKAVRGRQS
jgi:glycosyltransferase involved in cell wall biosynthesis